jgi:hemerythrin
MSINWNDRLKTNIPIIDEQHKTIINLLSGIKTSMLSKSEIYTLLSELQGILFAHFDLEDNYMRQARYPEYETHKAEHDQVREDYKKILTKNDADYSPSEIALELINYVHKWFLVHYKNEDVKMAEYLKKNV